MHRFLRLFHTVRHLRLQQLVYQVFYRLSRRLQRSNAKENSNAFDASPSILQPLPPSFTFLNQTKTFKDVSAIDWNYKEYGKLWTYNLNYFEFLRYPQTTTTDAQALIDDWITKSAAHLDGWEPYPMSLRIVQWIRFYQERELVVPAYVLDSLYRQYRSLQGKIEYHLLGNHLLENAIALTMAADFFEDEQYHKKASALLLRQLKEQYLPTGCHFERSTMYHCILLWRLLDLYAHGKAYADRVGAKQNTAPKLNHCYFEVLTQSIINQLNWLKYVVDEHGNYPHFNDSVDGVAPSVTSLFDYAMALNLAFDKSAFAPALLPDLVHWTWPASSPVLDVWIDASSVGPAYIPGHAHADDLTFCLSLNGRGIIVDPAISTYEKNERRAWERSTAAHNTVTVNDQNSSDVWGGFRVGKRARTTIESREAGHKLVARHNGYQGGHRRVFELEDGVLSLTDSCADLAVARFHFDHACPVALIQDGLEGDGFTMSWSSTAQAELTTYQQATGYNQLRTAQVLELTFEGKLITTLTNHFPSLIR